MFKGKLMTFSMEFIIYADEIHMTTLNTEDGDREGKWAT